MSRVPGLTLPDVDGEEISPWDAATLVYAASREGAGETLLWMLERCPDSGPGEPIVFDRRALHLAEPTLYQLARLCVRLALYPNVARPLAWVLANADGVEPLLERLRQNVQDAGVDDEEEGAALLAVLAKMELDMLLAALPWQDPREVLNEETVPEGVSWKLILEMARARRSRATTGKERDPLTKIIGAVETLLGGVE